MKKIKSYTGIWNVEKVLYAINDFNLPFPVTFTQITWFVIMEFIIILFGDSDLRKLMADIQVEEQNHAEMLYKYKTANGMQ